jgi:hypothetical protein
MNRKVLGFLVVCASMALAQGGNFRPGGPGGRGPGGRGGPGGERVVTGAPYSGVEVHTFQETLGDGNVINRTKQTALYRDSQGRTRTETTVTPPASSGKQPFTMISISDPVAGKRYELNSSTMTVRTSRMPVHNPSSTNGANGQVRRAAPTTGATTAGTTSGTRTGRGGAAITKTDLGSGLKNGVLAAGSRETEVIQSGKVGNTQPITVVRETWYSAELKRAVEVKVADPQRGNSTIELTNLVPGEPSAAFFTVPAGYTEEPVKRGGRGGGPAFNRGGH